MDFESFLEEWEKRERIEEKRKKLCDFVQGHINDVIERRGNR